MYEASNEIEVLYSFSYILFVHAPCIWLIFVLSFYELNPSYFVLIKKQPLKPINYFSLINSFTLGEAHLERNLYELILLFLMNFSFQCNFHRIEFLAPFIAQGFDRTLWLL